MAQLQGQGLDPELSVWSFALFLCFNEHGLCLSPNNEVKTSHSCNFGTFGNVMKALGCKKP